MARSLPEDILFLLPELVYYDERRAQPDYLTLLNLCRVSHAVRRRVQLLLFRWVQIFSSGALASFTEACARRPSLARAVTILHIAFERPISQFDLFSHLERVLAGTPRVRALFLEYNASSPTEPREFTLPSAYRIGNMPISKSLTTLHLRSEDNRLTQVFLDIFPTVDRLKVELKSTITSYPIYRISLKRPFVELSISVPGGGRPLSWSYFATVSDANIERIELLSLQGCIGYPGGLFRSPMLSFRSLRVDTWNDDARYAASLCPQLTELVLWPGLTLELSVTLAESLPVTLEHFAFPGDDFLDSPSTRAAEATSVSALPKRLAHLRCVSIFGSSQSWWSVLLSVNCKLAGIAVDHYWDANEFEQSCFSLERGDFPRRFNLAEFTSVHGVEALEDDFHDALARRESSILDTIFKWFSN